MLLIWVRWLHSVQLLLSIFLNKYVNLSTALTFLLLVNFHATSDGKLSLFSNATIDDQLLMTKQQQHFLLFKKCYLCEAVIHLATDHQFQYNTFHQINNTSIHNDFSYDSTLFFKPSEPVSLKFAI